MSFLDRLLRRKKTPPSPDGVKTAPLDPGSLGLRTDAEGRRHMVIGASQSTGIERTHNEDSLFILLGNSYGEEAMPDFGVFIVADGMGGHRSGEVASAISVRTVAQSITRDGVLDLFEFEPGNDRPPLQELVRKALEQANQRVVDRVPGGGTTLTLAVLLGTHMTIGHVGDSRAYVISNNHARVITRDHSLVERLRELGQLTPEEAAAHPQRNVLYRAIGQGANLEVDVFTEPIPQDGYLLLCSDGLWGVVSDDDILRIVSSSNHPQMACDELVRAANAAGGPDNITAVLVYFPQD
jgi:serine/threonine protein phosphatase PrpC